MSSTTLVVYHSRTGHTRRVAEALAKRLDADLEEIVTDTPREWLTGYALCALEAMTQCTPDLKRARHDPAHYERVLIGTPVWCWSLSSPVRAWVRRHPLGKAKLAFFCTMGGSGAERVFAQLEEACARAPEATLALTEQQPSQDIEPALDRFIAALERPTSAKGARKAAPKPAAKSAPKPVEKPPAKPAPRRARAVQRAAR
jgi:menaquinone-dependent protoporphyrinogen IX oxidase